MEEEVMRGPRTTFRRSRPRRLRATGIALWVRVWWAAESEMTIVHCIGANGGCVLFVANIYQLVGTKALDGVLDGTRWSDVCSPEER